MGGAVDDPSSPPPAERDSAAKNERAIAADQFGLPPLLRRQQRKNNKGFGTVARAALFWSYLRSILYSAIGIPTAIILARLLEPSDFGIAAVATFFGQLAGRLSSAGMGTALIRVKILREEHVGSVFLFNSAISLTLSVVLLLVAPYIGAFYDSPDVTRVMPLVALNFFVSGLFAVPQALISREMRYKEMSAAGTCDFFVASVSACAMAWLGAGYVSLVLSDVFGGLAKGAMTSYYVRWRPRFCFSRAALRELFSFGMGSYAKRMFDHAALHADNLIVGRLLGLTLLGFYEKGFNVGHKLLAKMTVVGPGVSFRIFSIIQDDPERFRRAYRKVTLSTTLVGYPIFAGLAAVAEPLFLVAFGEKWLPSVVPFQILCLAFVLKLTNTYAGMAAQSRGWIWSQVWRLALNVVLIGVGVFVAVPWGINGAAVGVLGATTVTYVLMVQLLKSATELKWRDIFEPQIPALVCSGGLAALVQGAELMVVSMNPAASAATLLVVQSILGALFYAAFLRFSRFEDVRALVNETWEDISPKLSRAVRLSA